MIDLLIREDSLRVSFQCMSTLFTYAMAPSDGPLRYTVYSLILIAITIAATLVFTPFLPASVRECGEWRRQGEARGSSLLTGTATVLLGLCMVGYGFVFGILLLDAKTACLPAVGGSGC